MAGIALSKITDLSKVKKEYLLLIYIVLIAGIAFFAYRSVFTSLIGEIKTVSKQIEQRKVSIQKARISPQALDKLEEQIKAIKSKMQDYEEKLKAEATIPQILKELNRIGERLKIKFVSVTPLARKRIRLPQSDDFLIQIPIRIKLSCGYHQLGLFINYLENSSRFVKITALKLNAGSRDIWRQSAELTIASFSLIYGMEFQKTEIPTTENRQKLSRSDFLVKKIKSKR